MTSDERIERTARKLRNSGVVFVVATMLLVAGVVYAVWGVQSVTERVTVIEQSPCRIKPQGTECQRAIHQMIEALPQAESCLLVQPAFRPSAFSRLTRCEGGM